VAVRYADFELGLIWDAAQESFDVNLRFTDAANVDRVVPLKGSVRIDLPALAALVNSEEEYAQKLTETIFEVPAIRDFYRDVTAATGAVPVHFRLHIDGSDEFHSIRWELLRDPDAPGAPIATSRNVLFSRYLGGGDWRPVPNIPARNLRALIVIAGPADLADYQPAGRRLAPVRVAEELAAAQSALAPFGPVALARAGAGEATLAETIARLEDGFDILYLVGHGAQTADVPLIFFENADGTADPVDARRLEERIRNLDRRPTLVVLNSCQSGGTGDLRHSEDGGALAALGPRLARAGVAAVVAMQGDVTMATASTFATTFFAEFAQDKVVDRAMAVARDAVRDRPDWWVPVLFSRLRSGRIDHEPRFAEREESTWGGLKVKMRTGDITPVVGPGLSEGILGSRQEIAQRWARRWQMPLAPYGRSNLVQVAQYLRVGQDPATVSAYLHDYLKTELLERIQNARGDDPFVDLPGELVDGEQPEQVILEIGRRLRARDGGDSYRVVAALPVKVFVTTGWTDLLQEALREANPRKEPLTLCFPWTDRVDWADQETPDPPTVERPWVYHLGGRLEQPESLVLTEDDYFEWLTEWIDKKLIIHPAVRGALTRHALLFLGYRLDDWDFRVVFQAIKSFRGGIKAHRHHHIGVQLRPESQLIEREAAQRYLESYFGIDNVNIFWSDTRTFLDRLCERTGIRP
jgi:hypothetical protein